VTTQTPVSSLVGAMPGAASTATEAVVVMEWRGKRRAATDPALCIINVFGAPAIEEMTLLNPRYRGGMWVTREGREGWRLTDGTRACQLADR